MKFEYDPAKSESNKAERGQRFSSCAEKPFSSFPVAAPAKRR